MTQTAQLSLLPERKANASRMAKIKTTFQPPYPNPHPSYAQRRREGTYHVPCVDVTRRQTPSSRNAVMEKPHYKQ